MVTLPLYLLAFLDRQSLILMICVWRDDDQAEWVGSRKQHVSGFQKIINIMSVKFKTRHLLTPTKLYNMFFVQIMNVYECNGKNIFMSCKMKSFIFQQMKIFFPLHECKTFITCFMRFVQCNFQQCNGTLSVQWSKITKSTWHSIHQLND